MAKITLKRKTTYTRVSYKLGKEEQLNTMELDIISKGEIPYLLPAVYSKGIGGEKIIIRVEDCMEFQDYLRCGISFGAFLDCVHQVIKVVQECESHGIRSSNLSLRLDGCFFDYVKKEIRVCFWPVLALEEYSDIRRFLNEMGEAYVAKEEDGPDRKEYMALFATRAKFDTIVFEEQINRLETHWFARNQPTQAKKKARQFETDGLSTIKTLQQMERGKEDSRTSVLAVPYLIREKTKTRVPIQKTPFTLGKKQEYCDYVVTGNQYVSRKHLTILQKENEFFAKDEGASNKSKVDGVELLEGRMAAIHEGSVLRVGGEDFTFHRSEHR